MRMDRDDTFGIFYVSGGDKDEVDRALIKKVEELKQQGFTDFEFHFHVTSFSLTETDDQGQPVVQQQSESRAGLATVVNLVTKSVVTFRHFGEVVYRKSNAPAPTPRAWWRFWR